VDETFTVIVQIESGKIVLLLKVNEVPPGTAARVAEPPQPVKVDNTGLARKTLAGRLSVSEACVRVMFGSLLFTTIVNWLVPPVKILLGLKLLPIVGA